MLAGLLQAHSLYAFRLHARSMLLVLPLFLLFQPVFFALFSKGV